MKKFAVIGSPISHSLSPQIHSLFAKQAQIEISYEAIEIIQSDFNSKVNQLFEDGYSGINVTLPLKETAFLYADKKSEEALLAESVNTLFLKGSSVCGETTDGQGLLLDLQSKGIESEEVRSALVKVREEGVETIKQSNQKLASS